MNVRAKKEAISEAMAHDQYFTQKPVAEACWDLMQTFLEAHQVHFSDFDWLEPSAGGGVFIDTAPSALTLHAFDLMPQHPRVRPLNFLEDSFPISFQKPVIVIGNPPFGKKAKLANAFIERSIQTLSPQLIGFILPLQFRKWSAQKHINTNWRLLADHDLPEEAFELCGMPYRVRCCFQIWAQPQWPQHPNWPDLRLKQAPPTSHVDFEAYQYNRTKEAEKYFDWEWDFAVPRQGFVDYQQKAYHAQECDRKKQWIFFKAKHKKALRVLLSLDFEALSKKNIGTPGFGKADVVAAYEEAIKREPHA